MAPSQLKQLKATLHQQRQSKGKQGKGKPSSHDKPFSKHERPQTTQERAHALRTKTLLPEIQRRNKVGGIVDRRFGEDDPTLAPEERALQRFTQSQRSKRRDVFNLEDASDDEEGIALTHLGKPLSLQDDFQPERDLEEISDDEIAAIRDSRKRKLDEALERVAAAAAAPQLEGDEQLRKRTKKEVMEEVIAKSKFHKYERQKVKEDDDEIREKLDQSLPELLAALRGGSVQMSNGKASAKDQAAQEYDQRLRQMAQDKRAAPTERTKTAEEKAQEDAERLRDLEARRLRRMQGEEVESSNDDQSADDDDLEEDLQEDFLEDEEPADEAAGFGIQAPSKIPKDVEDEDDFIIDEDLVASASDIDDEDISSLGGESSSEHGEDKEDDDAEFLRDVLPVSDSGKLTAASIKESAKSLAYTYPCPQSLEEFLAITSKTPPSDVPVIVQRIRALYHPQLAAENKTKLAGFASVLVEFVANASSNKPQYPVQVTEQLIRHVHSLSRSFGDSIAAAFRKQLEQMSTSNEPPTAGHLTILTAISTIYPTSDHFHAVVTPAITIISRWLGIVLIPCTTRAASLRGAYLVALCIRYQRLSKRYIPEAIRFTRAVMQSEVTLTDSSLVTQHIANIRGMLDLWGSETAFIEIFTPVLEVLSKAPASTNATSAQPSKRLASHLRILLEQAQKRRRYLELHHHRPLPIKTSIPRFEEGGFNPAAHYDPDKERSEAAKLRKEYKHERKGALRELRKDAEFMAREQLREKKERDRVYEEKQRRIIGEIQREEGREKNQYEREKRQRKQGSRR